MTIFKKNNPGCNCCQVKTCSECGVIGRAVEIDIAGVGVFVTGVFAAGTKYCLASYEGEAAPCLDFDMDVIAAEPDNGFGFPAGWQLGIGYTGIGTPLGSIGPFNDCDDLLSEAGVLHEDVAIDGCGTRDITLTLLP